MATPEEAKLESFILWLQANGVELRGCNIKHSDSSKGFGIFADKDVSDGVLLVVPLDLAITPMRVLQDPLLGPECRAMFEDGEVDDRFLINLFLTVERLRKNSSWKPYLNMFPTTFGNPLWFSDDELQELKGTALHRATELQKKSLVSLYDTKVKTLVKKLLTLAGDSEMELSKMELLSTCQDNFIGSSEVCFEDFLWANSVFWSRAMNIPLLHSYVFPETQEVNDSGIPVNKCSESKMYGEGDEKKIHVEGSDSQAGKIADSKTQGDTVWVEGIVPGVDFCNHDLKAVATWEVDGTGSITGVPFSMYLLSAAQSPLQNDREISISYGNKGNEELLYLYGFVIENNPDDYLMVHYPVEAINTTPFSESKIQLLEEQKAEMRCLLPTRLLDDGFFPADTVNGEETKKRKDEQFGKYSWSGQRKMPSYMNKLVFPENFMTTLRTVAMQENELFKVSSLLEELVGDEGKRELSDTDVRSAVWEACGDSGALQLLVDLLHAKLMDLEESTGTEESDHDLLRKALVVESMEDGISKQYNNNLSISCSTRTIEPKERVLMTRNKWSAIVYRQGQKRLTRLFLKEAEYALQLSINEDS